MTELRIDPDGRGDLTVVADTALTVEVPDGGDLWSVIARLHPSEALLERLAAVEDAAAWGDWPEWLHPIDTDITLNGDPWGWTLPVNDWEAGDDSWFLLPVGFFDHVVELASTSIWQSASMTGAVIPTTCLSSNGVSYGWQIFDEEGLTWSTLASATTSNAPPSSSSPCRCQRPRRKGGPQAGPGTRRGQGGVSPGVAGTARPGLSGP